MQDNVLPFSKRIPVRNFVLLREGNPVTSSYSFGENKNSVPQNFLDTLLEPVPRETSLLCQYVNPYEGVLELVLGLQTYIFII
jgi:hypothetical protein